MARPTEAAVILVLAAALGLTACGRKGALESPSTGQPKTEAGKGEDDIKSNPQIDRVLGKP